MFRFTSCFAVLLVLAGVSPAKAGIYDLTHTFNDPTSPIGEHFGKSVPIDGNYVLIAEPVLDGSGTRRGQAHLFTVPEPSTFILSAIALVGLLLFVWRRKRQA